MKLPKGTYHIHEFSGSHLPENFAALADHILDGIAIGCTLAEHPKLGTVLIVPQDINHHEDRAMVLVPPELLRWMLDHDMIHPECALGATNTRN